ncbi:MAG: ABC transporter substrate-binding protein, partial [Acidiferrobacteraceae bacterium]|nr:ABC transporter substrate-binding protein [Acidiferrobacteraceae bacterium]
VKTALRESRVKGRRLGLRFTLNEQALNPGESAVDAIHTLFNDTGATVFIADLPLAEVLEIGQSLKDQPVIVLNARHADDILRGSACSPTLFHTMPSHAMLMDALAQFLSSKNWKRVLILQGDAPNDQLLADAFAKAAAKFRLKQVDRRSFVLSNDPRIREKNNVALITSGARVDVIFLADSVGEFGRYVPYQTQKPTLVVGSEGLHAGAWHWTWERYGAPQLNQRFDRVAKRRMTDTDYAGWAAVKTIVEAITRTSSIEPLEIKRFLVSNDMTFDAYKGAPGNFRPWDHQLRQPLLLHLHNAVVTRAPLPGFLHRSNNLDTLGIDSAESNCRM